MSLPQSQKDSKLLENYLDTHGDMPKSTFLPQACVLPKFPAEEEETVTSPILTSRDCSMWESTRSSLSQNCAMKDTGAAERVFTYQQPQARPLEFFEPGATNGHTHSYDFRSGAESAAVVEPSMITPQHSTVSTGTTHFQSPITPNTCSSCYTVFGSNTSLQDHSKQSGHSSYKCTCGSGFSRIDSLNRHIRDFLPGIYACTFCTRHVGNNAFRRKYHLIQHLKGYHKMGRETLRVLVKGDGHDGE
ncbi:hypothetical protein HYFRA_00002265 [Hymenoscyphus fraxineus]|uniref:C2H2-type domain-containing protein n=1 Tax=Hymenoscyphus fraxineus TaxID=746836 RepID=A0A9N9L7X4_9HELO|nr:hypothetical protein HYFRA_00002265 [Hymenoscyphus fraxineus]